ncbi:alpha/beta fold hydrolase [Streptomyces sp. NPDC049936]|uniref:alpha/beta fold hydrolase n=1 Tax=Streptomyces sp. NPDC049936 TaxID=3365599 RepID=UPI0037B10F13
MRHRRVQRGRGDEELFETEAGNTLAYRYTKPSTLAGTHAPTLVFETGMFATDVHWAWYRQFLGDKYKILTYSRAGYGRSEFSSRNPFTLSAAVSDLRDLIRHCCQAEPVVLVGHSVGGFLAMRAAELLPGSIQGLVMIDPSHPGQLLRSKAQIKGAEKLGFHLSLMPESTKLGLGSLLDVPSWVSSLPEDEQRLCRDQFRDWKVWKTAKREWTEVRREFLSHDGSLPKIGFPALLIAADRTRLDDTTTVELHDELAAAAMHGRVEVIDNCGHLEVLVEKASANQATGHIDTFIRNLNEDAYDKEEKR